MDSDTAQLLAYLLEAEGGLAAALMFTAQMSVTDYHDLSILKTRLQAIRRDIERSAK